MIRIRQGSVLEIKMSRRGLQEVTVEIPGEGIQKAYCFDIITGPVAVGDRVILNTTAVAKSLGTGGAHFVMANITRPFKDYRREGHIMKLRYSPGQVKVLAAEEPDSPHAEKIQNADSLEGTPVVVGTLHSMLPPAAAGVKVVSGAGVRVVYVMTDGAALPLPLSNLVHRLKQESLVDATVTCGHAFGGDLETINIYTALLAAHAVLCADVIIVTMGPGIVGTASRYGFTGVEQGEIINAVNILGGRPVAIPRISFADTRERHRGISHHTVTALGRIALTPSTLVLPELADQAQTNVLLGQAQAVGLAEKHRLVLEDGRPALEELQRYGIKVTSMGRSVQEDPAFFLASGAAGVYTGKLLKH